MKTLEFLNSRRPDLEIRTNFIHQLTAYENHLAAQGIGAKTSKWTEVHDKTNEFENEELLLRNTYLNAQMGPFADFSLRNDWGKSTKIKWVDNDAKSKLATEILEDEGAINENSRKTNCESIIKKQKVNPANSRNGAGVVASASVGCKDNTKLENSHKQTVRDISPEGSDKSKKIQVIKPQQPLVRIKSEEKQNKVDNKLISKQVITNAIKNSTKDKSKNLNVSLKVKKDDIPIRAQVISDKEVINPKYNNFILDNSKLVVSEQKQSEKLTNSLNQMYNFNAALAEGKSGPVTQIINQNNINNFIIQNPQKVEVIEYVHKDQKVIKHVAPQRPSSASVKRDNQNASTSFEKQEPNKQQVKENK